MAKIMSARAPGRDDETRKGSGDFEPAANESEPVSLQKLQLDPLGQRLAHKFGMARKIDVIPIFWNL
jgi:hypothetical protein